MEKTEDNIKTEVVGGGEKKIRLIKTVGFLDAAALIIGFIIG